MPRSKFDLMVKYLRDEFPGSALNPNFKNVPADSTIAVGTRDGKDLLLMIGGIWLLDTPIEDIPNFLTSAKIAETLSSSADKMLLISTDGVCWRDRT